MLQLSINIAFKISLNQTTKEQLLEHQLSKTCLLGGGVVCWVFLVLCCSSVFVCCLYGG